MIFNGALEGVSSILFFFMFVVAFIILFNLKHTRKSRRRRGFRIRKTRRYNRRKSNYRRNNYLKYTLTKGVNYGEVLVSSELNRIDNAIVIDNLTFTIKKGKTCQIDHILICTKGIFVVETKSYVGKIYGEDDWFEWYQYTPSGEQIAHYSPVKQNQTHILALFEKTGIPSANNLVVFVDSDISSVNSIYTHSINTIKYLIENQPDKFSLEEVKVYAQRINAINEFISNEEHVENIHKLMSNIENNICPRCGASLVLRKGEYGDFYSCSNFPKCKFKKYSQ